MRAEDIIGAVEGVTKKWAKQRKREERECDAEMNRRYAMTRRMHVSIKDAAWSVMEEAYMKASAGGTLPAHARQIMYAARGRIQAMASKPLSGDFDKYFTQTLLPDYIADHPRCSNWNVVFDARGHFQVPHVEMAVPLGTLEVREYLKEVSGFQVPGLEIDITEPAYPTRGPKDRFGAILFIEKEGFMPLFKHVQLAERYDIALMSTKGMSNTASRELVDRLSTYKVPLLTLHDFDKSGFSILGTLQRDNRRYTFAFDPEVIDLGLRLEDIEGLETEDVRHKDSEIAIRLNLRENGATKEEANFLMSQRVELNALPSDQLVAFVERKLQEHGVKKVIPDDATLAAAYRRMRRQAVIQARIDELMAELESEEHADAPVPDDLRARIADAQKADSARRWDGVLASIARADHDQTTA